VDVAGQVITELPWLGGNLLHDAHTPIPPDLHTGYGLPPILFLEVVDPLFELRRSWRRDRLTGGQKLTSIAVRYMTARPAAKPANAVPESAVPSARRAVRLR
jgi:hypothetical protein